MSPWELGLGLDGSRLMEGGQGRSKPRTDILSRSLGEAG